MTVSNSLVHQKVHVCNKEMSTRRDLIVILNVFNIQVHTEVIQPHRDNMDTKETKHIPNRPQVIHNRPQVIHPSLGIQHNSQPIQGARLDHLLASQLHMPRVRNLKIQLGRQKGKTYHIEQRCAIRSDFGTKIYISDRITYIHTYILYLIMQVKYICQLKADVDLRN